MESDEPKDGQLMPIDRAMYIADLWKQGKWIGADVDDVCMSLYEEVLRLRKALENSAAPRK